MEVGDKFIRTIIHIKKESMFKSAGEVRTLPVEFCGWPISFQMTAGVPILQTHLRRKNYLGNSFVTSTHLAGILLSSTIRIF